jgi:hypothetical protein
MPGRIRLVLALCALAAVQTSAAGQDLTRAEADSMEHKLVAIFGRATIPPRAGAAPLQTSFTDREVNAFFKFNGKDALPTGVVNPQVTIPSPGRIEARAIVDLDAVRLSEKRSLIDPLNLLLRGTVEVRAAGFFRAAQGVGTLQLESATCAGITIPKSLLQELITYYTRSPDLPAGFNLDKPFALPANIREVRTQRGAATVIQ